MATPAPVTDELARFVTETDFASISETTRANARMHILDTLGVAMAFFDGKLEIATCTDEKVNQTQVQDALSKVKVIVDESIPEPGPYCPLSVELKDGTRHSYTAKITKGDPRNPMSEAEVMEKFLGNARTAISEGQTEAVINAVNRLESLDPIKTIVQALAV